MKIIAFLWDEANVGHIASHGVRPWEVEQVFRYEPRVRHARADRYLALGVSEAGRHLVVVFRYVGRGIVRAITARDMTVKERRLYAKK